MITYTIDKLLLCKQCSIIILFTGKIHSLVLPNGQICKLISGLVLVLSVSSQFNTPNKVKKNGVLANMHIASFVKCSQ